MLPLRQQWRRVQDEKEKFREALGSAIMVDTPNVKVPSPAPRSFEGGAPLCEGAQIHRVNTVQLQMAVGVAR